MTVNVSDCQFPEADLVAAFNFLTPEERMEVCHYLTVKDYSAKELLMKENEPSDFMGFIARGRLAVKKQTGFEGKYIILAILEKGTIVGETEILGHGPRSSTIVAVEDCRLMTLTDQSLDQLLEDNSALGVKILKRVIYVTSLRLRKAGERLSQLL